MQFGNINTGRFEYNAVPESTHLYSWPMNNYWTTNFNADQRGMYTWTYNFTSVLSTNNEKATRFSWGARVPFLARVIPGGKKDASKIDERSLISNIPDQVLLINVTPLENENAVLFQFREIANNDVSFLPKTILGDKASWSHVNVIGEEIEQVEKLEIKSLESKFYKLSW